MSFRCGAVSALDNYDTYSVLPCALSLSAETQSPMSKIDQSDFLMHELSIL